MIPLAFFFGKFFLTVIQINRKKFSGTPRFKPMGFGCLLATQNVKWDKEKYEDPYKAGSARDMPVWPRPANPITQPMHEPIDEFLPIDIPFTYVF